MERLSLNEEKSRTISSETSTTNRWKMTKRKVSIHSSIRPSFIVSFTLLIYLLIVKSQVITSQQQNKLPDLTSATSGESIVAVIGQDAFISCVAKNLQNYTIIWRFTNEASAPGNLNDGVVMQSQQDGDQATTETGSILTAGRQRVIADDRFTIIQSHDTWLLKISNVRQSDSGTYICQTNSSPRVRVLRILSVVKPTGSNSLDQSRADHFDAIDYNFSDCCRGEYVIPRCQRLCSFQQLASKYQSINMVHECFSALPSITRCMVAGRNVTDCCQKRHIPVKCNPMCGHQGDTSNMSVQDQTYCADYSAAIMSCVAEGISTLPGQPELVIVEAISSTTLKVSWQKVSDEKEFSKIDGWIINLTKLSSFEDSIDATKLSLPFKPTQSDTTMGNATRVSSSFSISSSSSSSSSATTTTPLASLNIVDVMNNSSLAAMTKLLAASSGTISLKLDKNLNEFSIDNLKPYTVYQIQMFAYNSKGRSQLTDPIRALTLAPENDAGSLPSQPNDGYVEPNLPDTRKCCLDRGVTLKRCLDTMCDPVEADRATIADLMICAPWSNVTFSCLSSRVNHTDCCKSRGVSQFCLNMCSGEVKRVDYRHFRCLTHMSTYTSCILESHNVLPSQPQNFTVGPITHTWAVLNWRAPKKHARSLQGYRIFWRRVDPATQIGSNSTAKPKWDQLMGESASLHDNSNDDFFYSSAEAATNPYLLDALQPGTVYETFVVAVNRYGQSESSVRFVFQTLADPEEVSRAAGMKQSGEIESRLPIHGNATQQQSYYNETACCSNSGVHNSCLQLCDYDVKVSDVSGLVTSCNLQMPVILRCMAGSRNSVPCCRSRGVNDQCLNVCAGLSEHSPLVVATRCASDFGKIIRCMDEGSKQIPSAPIDLHTVDIKTDRITIKWQAAPEDSLRTDIEYHVRYQQLQNTQSSDDSSVSGTTEDPASLIAVVPLHPLEHNLIFTTNKTEATIDKLNRNSRYSIYVTAENGYGISLPSLVLVTQTPDSDNIDLDPYKRRATLGAPHSLEILRSDTESIVLKWIAPLFINNDAQIKYRVFYKLISSTAASNSTADTSSTIITPTTTLSPTTGNSDSTPAPVQQLASNWTVIETTDTTIALRHLRYSSQYAMTVQAYSKSMLGHMSDILLANTAKPVPPTLNHPLVINNPIEGNNITIMCVALGQPTPQISMFINGLLVQKRTQPYVIYHLVNLVRGHLTITCFASNGHGKDYASVQSRTEVSVKFPSKVNARVKEVRANAQSSARMTCDVSGNPQPTVVWVFTPEGQTVNGSHSTIVVPNERITTLLLSQFENPFTWSHTLTIRNVSQSDLGIYQCRSRNVLSESTDAIRLISSETIGSVESQTTGSINRPDRFGDLKQLESQSDLMECCKSQNVSSKCLPVCSVDGLDVESAFKTPECQPHLDKLMLCAADGSDHRNCCRTRQVPSTCLRWCSGARLNSASLCFLSSAIDINQCFHEGRSLLPGPPRNIRIMLASDSEHNEPSADISSQKTMVIAGMPGGLPFMSNQAAMTTTTPSDSGSNSVINSMANSMSDHHETESSSSSPSTTQSSDIEQQQSEPIIIEWDPPSKNPSLVQYYRIFWRPVNSRELSRTVTNLTWIRLDDLNVNRQYELVVKAANNHGSSVYTESRRFTPSELISQSNSIGSVGLIWFMPNTGAASLMGRVMVAICFATIFMFSSLALVMFLEKQGYLKRFASSKSNSSRISFANPAYLKDGDANLADGDTVVTWESGHSLDILAPPQQQPQSHDVTGKQNGQQNVG